MLDDNQVNKVVQVSNAVEAGEVTSQEAEDVLRDVLGQGWRRVQLKRKLARASLTASVVGQLQDDELEEVEARLLVLTRRSDSSEDERTEAFDWLKDKLVEVARRGSEWQKV